MGRPRKPSNVLELSGAFNKDPARRRVDPEGAGELDATPPTWLPRGCVEIWREVISQFPKITVTESDRQALGMLVMALRVARDSYGKPALFGKYMRAESSARYWLAQFGMTPVSRTKFAQRVVKGESNPYAEV